MKKILTSLCSLAAVVAVAKAEKPFNASFWAPDAQLVPPSEDIRGVRLNFLYGKNNNVKGVDFGTGNVVTNDFSGLQFCVFIPCVYNSVGGTTRGVQWGIVNRSGLALYGADLGAVNFNVREGSHITGAQLAVVNATPISTISGAQIGFVNVSRDVHGLQLGLVNYCKTLKGVQVGLWNQVDSRGWDFKPLPKVFPIVNFGGW